MAHSQNGYSANVRSVIRTYTVPGTTVKLSMRQGDVATILLYVARRYHREVEHLHRGWCWGFAVRRIRGASALSNHASGTAIDLNAPRHPLGTSVSHSFSRAQVAAIRRILRSCTIAGHPVVRWGGFYSGRKDPMHWEILSSAHVHALAVAIRSGKVK